MGRPVDSAALQPLHAGGGGSGWTRGFRGSAASAAGGAVGGPVDTVVCFK